MQAVSNLNTTHKSRTFYKQIINAEFFRIRMSRYYGNILVRKINDNEFLNIANNFIDYFETNELFRYYFYRNAFRLYKFYRYEILPNKPVIIPTVLKKVEQENNKLQKDYLLFYILSSSLNARSNIYKLNFDSLSNEIYDPNWSSYIKNLIKEKEITNSNKDLIKPFNDKSTITFHQLLSRYKGKSLYIDFWASWCIPCREELRNSQKIRDKLKDTNSIKFIYISIDKNEEQWRVAWDIEDLSNYDANFLLLNPENADIISKLNISLIPKYIIVDKLGKIIHSDAPPPSDKNLINTFRQLQLTL